MDARGDPGPGSARRSETELFSLGLGASFLVNERLHSTRFVSGESIVTRTSLPSCFTEQASPAASALLAFQARVGTTIRTS